MKTFLPPYDFVVMDGDWKNSDYVKELIIQYKNAVNQNQGSLNLFDDDELIYNLLLSSKVDDDALFQDCHSFVDFLYEIRDDDLSFHFYMNFLIVYFFVIKKKYGSSESFIKELSFFVNAFEDKPTEFCLLALEKLFIEKNQNYHRLDVIVDNPTVFKLQKWETYQWVFNHTYASFKFYDYFIQNVYNKIKVSEEFESFLISVFLGHHYLLWKKDVLMAEKTRHDFFLNLTAETDLISYFKKILSNCDIDEKISFKKYIDFLMQDCNLTDKITLIKNLYFGSFLEFGQYMPKMPNTNIQKFKSELQTKITFYCFNENDNHKEYEFDVDSDIDVKKIKTILQNNELTLNIREQQFNPHSVIDVEKRHVKTIKKNDVENLVDFIKNTKFKKHYFEFLNDLSQKMFHSIVSASTKTGFTKNEIQKNKIINRKQMIKAYSLFKSVIESHQDNDNLKIIVSNILFKLCKKHYKTHNTSQYTKTYSEAINLLLKIMNKLGIPIKPTLAFFFMYDSILKENWKNLSKKEKMQIAQNISFKQFIILKEKFKKHHDD